MERILKKVLITLVFALAIIGIGNISNACQRCGQSCVVARQNLRQIGECEGTGNADSGHTQGQICENEERAVDADV